MDLFSGNGLRMLPDPIEGRILSMIAEKKSLQMTFDFSTVSIYLMTKLNLEKIIEIFMANLSKLEKYLL